MQCSNCHCTNPEGAKFCIECGTQLGTSCPNCSTSLPASAKFCIECGTFLKQNRDGVNDGFGLPENYIPQHLADRILSNRDALIGERKQVTVLFADVKGSTALIADQDSETADALLHPVVKLMIEAVHRYEGTVTRVAGDGIMALFGAPIAHEDHAVRACFAALVMQRLIKEDNFRLRRDYGVSVQIRVGMSSGEAIVRSIGNDLFMEYTAMGKVAHLAARMEQLADSGSTLLSSTTHRLAEGLVEVKDLGPVPVKGFDDPVNVYELISGSVTRRRFDAAALRGLTTFVGRESEFGRLEQAIDQARQGRGQMVAVVGEAAVGKSRLFYEFTRSNLTAGWLVLEGTSSSFGKATPFLPVIDLLRNYFDIEVADSHRTVQEKVSGKIVTLDKALAPYLSALLTLMDVPVNDDKWETMDASERRRLTLEACKSLLLQESRNMPLVVVFEDLHWVDSKTQAFLDSFVDNLPNAQILLLVNYRPEYRHSWASRPFYTQVYLEPLSERSAMQLLDVKLGLGPESSSLKKLLIEQSQGNPFFLEESVRVLVETGILAGQPGAYRLTKPISSIDIPPTVQAVLAARIDRLPPDVKLVLQTASVIGESFSFPMLATIMESDALHGALDDLQAQEFLYETALFPEHEYTFKHGLTYQVAYNSLLQEHRRSLHVSILNAMEAREPDPRGEEVDRFAHHAYEGEVWDKAVRYLRTAGTRAAQRSAYDEAVRSFERALTALEHMTRDRTMLEQSLDIQFELRTSLFPLGRHDQVLQCLRTAKDLAGVLEDPVRQAWVSIYQCHYFWLAGKPAESYEIGLAAKSTIENMSNLSLTVTVNYYLGLACLSVGRQVRAVNLLRSNVELLNGSAARERYGVAGYPAAMSRTYLAWALAECGKFSEGIRYGQDGVFLAKELNHAWTLVTAFWGLATLHIVKGDANTAVDLLEQALPLSTEWRLDAITPGVCGSLGFAYAMTKRVKEGVEMLQEAINEIELSGRLAFCTLFKIYLSEGLISQGEVRKARFVAGEALESAKINGEKGLEAMALRALAETQLKDDTADGIEADRLYTKALELAQQLNMRPLAARCNLGLAQFHKRSGQIENFHRYGRLALTEFRKMEMYSYLDLCKLLFDED